MIDHQSRERTTPNSKQGAHPPAMDKQKKVWYGASNSTS